MEKKVSNNNTGPVLVTGGSGFIGNSLVSSFLADGIETHVLDKVKKENVSYINKWNLSPNFSYFEDDLLDLNFQMRDYDIVCHLAANPEVRVSSTDPLLHFNQNILATFNLLEKIRKSKIKRLVFASSSTVYGEPTQIPTPENYSPLEPISPYGATKLACESLMASYAHTYGLDVTILRFANVIGPTSKHGIIYDLINKLHQDSSILEVLGDGKQNKSYLHITDCIDAIRFAIDNSKKRVETFNVGSSDSIEVSKIVSILIEAMNLKDTKIVLTGGVDGGRGWIGDVKRMILDVAKLNSLGWRPRYNSEDAVRLTIKSMLGENKNVS